MAIDQKKSIRCKAKGCDKHFTPKRSSAKFCSDTCRKRNSRPSKIKAPKQTCTGYTLKDSNPSNSSESHRPCTANNGTPKQRSSTGVAASYTCMTCRRKSSEARIISNLDTNWFIRRLWSESKRAGTVEIIQNMEDLSFYLRISKQSRQFNGHTHSARRENDEIKEYRTYSYNLCHRVPVKGHKHIGLLNPDNLYIGSAQENRKASNKEIYPVNIGVNCIERNALQEQYKIPTDCSIKSFIRILETYLGKENLRQFAIKNQLKGYRKTQRDNPAYKAKVPAAFKTEVMEYNFFNDPSLPRDFKIQVSQIYFKAAKLVNCSELGFTGTKGALCYDMDAESLLDAPGCSEALEKYLSTKEEAYLEKALDALKRFWEDT